MDTFQYASIFVFCLEILSLIVFICVVFKKKLIGSMKVSIIALSTATIIGILINVIGYFYIKSDPSLAEELNKLSDMDIFSNVFTTITQFQFNNSLVAPLSNTSYIFRVSVKLGYFVQCLSFAWVVVSLFSLYLNNFLRIRLLVKKDCDFVLGYSEDSLLYLKKNKNKAILVLEEEDKELEKKLYLQGIVFITYQALLKIIKRIKRRTILKNYFSLDNKLKSFDKVYNVILFKDSSNQNEEYMYSRVIEDFKKVSQYGKPKKILPNVIKSNKIFLNFETNSFEDNTLKELYSKNVNCLTDNLYINCFNKYEILGREFVSENPISLNIPSSFYNDNRTIKKDKKINVVFLGFGNINVELFKSFISYNHFVEETGNADRPLREHPINYYIFDKNRDNASNPLFLHIDRIFESNKDLKDNQGCIERSFNKENIYTDIESTDTMQKIKEIVDEDGGNSFTYIIVSYGFDYQNSDMAIELESTFKNASDKVKIFARIKHSKINTSKLNNVILFGNETSIISREMIIDNVLLDEAQKISMLYDCIKSDVYMKSYDTMARALSDTINLIEEENKDNESKKYLRMINNLKFLLKQIQIRQNKSDDLTNEEISLLSLKLNGNKKHFYHFDNSRSFADDCIRRNIKFAFLKYSKFSVELSDCILFLYKNVADLNLETYFLGLFLKMKNNTVSNLNKYALYTKARRKANWANLSEIDKDSNYAYATSISFKLGLLNLSLNNYTNIYDFKKDFLGYYLSDNQRLLKDINRINCDLIEKGNLDDNDDIFKRIYQSDEDIFKEVKIRNVLAYSEHSNWVMRYIIQGFEVMPFAEVIKNNKMKHKNLNLKMHACLVSYYDLKTLMDLKKKQLNNNWYDNDLYGYDSMAIDSLPWVVENDFGLRKE